MNRFPSAEVFAHARSANPDRYLIDMARGRLQEPPVAPEAGLHWLAERLVWRTRNGWDAVVAITGEEGVGKSTGARRLIEEVEAITKVPFRVTSNLCYTARDVNSAYQGAKPSECIWYDEGARGLLAGETFSPEQEALVKALMLVRETGAILIICIPDIFALAKKVRGRRASYWVHVESRGDLDRPAPSVARVFERDRRLKFLPSNSLGLWVSPTCPTLTFEPFAENDTRWVAYKAVKKRKLAEFHTEVDATLSQAERRLYGKRNGTI